MKQICFWGVLALTGFIASARSEAPADPPTEQLFDPARHMLTSEVRPGMKGYGLSVFRGTVPEKFDVEVISVLRNQMGPKQDVILIRCSGQNLEHSGAIAGMSGSPIYLTDDQGRTRMIGAFALGWQFAKDPIAGVRPIEEMLRVPAEKREVSKPVSAVGQSAVRWDVRPLVRGWIDSPTARDQVQPVVSDPVRSLRPLTVPLAVSGANPRGLESFITSATRVPFQSMLIQAGSATVTDPQPDHIGFTPGSVIAVPIVTGDLELSAIGTVTEVIGDRVFAFGHEFNAEGPVELPMGPGYVHSVIANQAISFKLGSLIRTTGTIFSDESVGIAGTNGSVPRMIPVEITIQTPQRDKPQVYHYQLVRHPRFTPLGTLVTLAAAITGHNQLPPEFTLDYELKMEFEGGQVIHTRNSTTSVSGASELIRDLTIPVNFGVQNPYAKVYPSKITVKLDLRSDVTADTLRHVMTDKQVYRPGETVRLFVTTRSYQGIESTSVYELVLPNHLPDGPLSLTLSDAQRFASDQMRFSPASYQVNRLADVWDLARVLTGDRGDQLYARLTLPEEGLVVGRSSLTDLPGSRRQLFSRTPRADLVVFPSSLTWTWDRSCPLMGSVDLSIFVAQHPEKTTFPANPVSPQRPSSAPNMPQQSR
ncbi:MAG: hypothetical protein KatS3mg104_0914 [Phycisphaerae bacterium]|jgi:hypothetical protein|nr:MAG: hypothetical protein KatS3mg104_0914 [Phycisphaerae bacterium]